MEKLYENTWTHLDRGARIFLIVGEKKALLVDTGLPGLDVKAIAKEVTDLPLELLNTHADKDHIGANFQFDVLYMHPSEMPYYHNVQHGTGKIIPVYEGDMVDLGGRILEVIHLPGHTAGSITLLDREHRCLIGGDPIQEEGRIFMFGPHRDIDACIDSLERLNRRDDFDFIYPSHAKEKVSREVIPLLAEGLRKIKNGELEGEETEMFGNKVNLYDLGFTRVLY